MPERIDSFRQLKVYQHSFDLQQRLFEITKTFPKSEQFALVDQLRRCSRSIGANLAEAWQKRRYPAHFISKLSDADGELSETEHWVETSSACGYLSATERSKLDEEIRMIGSMIGKIMSQPQKWCGSHLKDSSL